MGSNEILLVKRQAKILKEFLKECGFNVQHGNCLHAVAKMNGYQDFKVMKKSLEES